jgi:hypothetical protein
MKKERNPKTGLVEEALLALNEMAEIADDLYYVIGQELVRCTPDEYNIILSAYEMLSTVHKKYESITPMPSHDYDYDDLDGAIEVYDDEDDDEMFDESADLIEDVNPNPKKTILSWNTSEDVENPYRFEVLDESAKDVLNIFESTGTNPSISEILNDAFTFDCDEIRDNVLEEMKSYYELIKECEVTVIDLTHIQESFDEKKFRRLAIANKFKDQDVGQMIIAIKNLQEGGTISPKQRSLIESKFLTIEDFITGAATFA